MLRIWKNRLGDSLRLGAACKLVFAMHVRPDESTQGNAVATSIKGDHVLTVDTRITNNGYPNSKMQTHINRVPRFASSNSAPRRIRKQAIASINSLNPPPSCATAEFEANASVTPRNNQENLILIMLIAPISMRQLAHGVEKITTKIGCSLKVENKIDPQTGDGITNENYTAT